jgi:hypothetical protein
MDLVAAQSRVAAGLDLYTGEPVAGDVVVLQQPQAIVVDVDTGLLAIADAVAAQADMMGGQHRPTRGRVA